MSSDFNNDLTTDACPSPPRIDDNDENKRENIRDQNNTEEVKENNQNDSKYYKVPPKYRLKKKPIPRTTKVVNIQNSSNVHVGDNYTIQMNSKEENCTDYVVTDAIRDLFSRNEPVTREDIIKISTHMNNEWKKTARALKYSEGQISQFVEDHSKSGVKEVIYQFLLDWIRYESIEATVGRLSTTLWKTNQQDAVQRWSKNFSE